MSQSNGCCDETVIDPTAGALNPLRDRGAKKPHRGQFVLLNSLANPIPKEVSDSEELKKFFQRFPYVPYAGTSMWSSHSLLVFYEMLRRLSPTHGACMSKKATYAFGTAATTIRARNPDFDTGEELVLPSVAERKVYEQALTEQLSFDRPIREFCREVSLDFESTGNGWVELTVAKEMGQARGRLIFHPMTNVMYVNTAPDEAKMVVISPIWTEEYLTQKPPKAVMMYPNWNEDENGAMHTMFHLKDGKNTWYGRPGSEEADMNKYSEVQLTFYRLRATYGEFTGKLIIEVESANPVEDANSDNQAAKDSGFDDYIDRFEDNYSNKGDNPQGVVIVSRPWGSKPMFVFSIPPNQNHYYFKGIAELDSEQILRSHECTKRFMSFDTTSSGFSHDAFIEDYVIHMEPVINHLRLTVMTFINKVVSAFWNYAGREELNAQSLWFGSPIDSTVEAYKVNKASPPATVPVVEK